MDEAIQRVTGEQLARLMFPQFDKAAERTLLANGLAASPGAAVGAAVFDSATAVARTAPGEQVLLVRRETNPDDLEGMIAATGVLTSRGGKTSATRRWSPAGWVAPASAGPRRWTSTCGRELKVGDITVTRAT